MTGALWEQGSQDPLGGILASNLSFSLPQRQHQGAGVSQSAREGAAKDALLAYWDAPGASPKKRARSRSEQAHGLAELFAMRQRQQLRQPSSAFGRLLPGGDGGGSDDDGSGGGGTAAQRERPIARSSWPGMLRLHSICPACGEHQHQQQLLPALPPSSCNSSMCSSQTSGLVLAPCGACSCSCSSPSSQLSSGSSSLRLAPFASLDAGFCHAMSLCLTDSNASTMSIGGLTANSGTSAAITGCWGAAAHSGGGGSAGGGISSRPAPGGALGDGISWVIPECGGREVLAEYEFGQTLGCGTFGVTRLVTHRQTARPWACKTICKASIAACPAAISDVRHEVAILQHLSGHNGIVQLQGVFEDERNIHLVMELCTGGDLLDYISRFGRLGEGEAADIARVMLTTLQHCHKHGVVHRDIKPENFLLGAPTLLLAPQGSAAAALKISDFGVSAFLTPGENFAEIVGTPFYMAPEVLERDYGPAADVWSVGVVVFLMLAGCLPFNGNTDRQIIKAVMDSEPDYGGPAWAGISDDAKGFVRQVLRKDPSRRATIPELLAHPWLQGRGPAGGSEGLGAAGAAQRPAGAPPKLASCLAGAR